MARLVTCHCHVSTFSREIFPPKTAKPVFPPFFTRRGTKANLASLFQPLKQRRRNSEDCKKRCRDGMKARCFTAIRRSSLRTLRGERRRRPHGAGHSVQIKFKEFIRNFEKEKNVFPYRESLIENPKFLLVHLEGPPLLRCRPPLSPPLLPRRLPSFEIRVKRFYVFEMAAAEVLASLKMKVDMEEPKTEEVQILLTSKEDSMSMRSLGAQYISKLVRISGITIAASRVKAKATYVHLSCKNCKSTIDVPCRPGLGGAIVPRSCGHLPQVGEEACPIDPWIVVPDKSQYVDQQTLKLQENPEDVPTGELPRNLLLSVDRHLVQTIVPGTRLTIMGIYSIFQAANSSASHKGAVAVRQPYIRVVGLEETNEASSRGPSAFKPEEVRSEIMLNTSSKLYHHLYSAVPIH
ncbi:hypothetical protein Patl1_14810 [Pistacia atlantica]|uniref:Uncharacterized protein n=1 Tax=Pistacia atlantica TaxID=434234 RepID=A0ACC1ASN6_9ROSI|nr:hypothetical protein Patl1_14810 [Pistacia atlantica]